jgi:predicted nucleotidyltransferase
MDNKDKDLMLEFRRSLPSDLANHVTRLIVFGSRVRNEAAEDSDLDVIALVDEKNSVIEKRLEDIAYQIMWDHNFRPIISLKVLSEAQFSDALSKGFSFYRHVEKEGVLV